MVRIFLILILLCNVALAKPIRLKDDVRMQEKKGKVALKQLLKSDADIDSMDKDEISEYLKTITTILNTLLN